MLEEVEAWIEEAWTRKRKPLSSERGVGREVRESVNVSGREIN